MLINMLKTSVLLTVGAISLGAEQLEASLKKLLRPVRRTPAATGPVKIKVTGDNRPTTRTATPARRTPARTVRPAVRRTSAPAPKKAARPAVKPAKRTRPAPRAKNAAAETPVVVREVTPEPQPAKVENTTES